MVSYFGLAQVGIGSSVNRYVARHRAQHDVEGLRRVTASTMALQAGVATFVVIVTAIVTYFLPVWFGEQLGADIGKARAVVALLGASLAVQMAFDLYRGIITGCHRWDFHNAIAAVSYAVQVVANIAALVAGYGVVGLGFTTLAVTIATEIVRARLAFRLCPEMRISPSLFDAGQARRSLACGIKTTAGQLAYLILIQGNSLLVASYAGVAQLALFARPMALIRHAEGLADKFAFVLTPVASSLQGRGDHAAIRSLLVDSTRLAACFVFPLMLALGVLGDAMLWAWMGPEYAHGHLLAALAIGYALSLSAKPAVTILAGLNQHGRLARQGLMAAACGLGLSFVLVDRAGLGLLGAAVGVSATRLVFGGIVAPAYACRVLGIPRWYFFRETFTRPFLMLLPFAVPLIVLRGFWAGGPWGLLAAAAALGTAVLGPLYWLYVLPPALKRRLLARIPGRAADGRRVAGPGNHG